MTIPLFHVDAFADQAFGGNPAAVCLLNQPADAGWMQRVAAEMNLSETAFVEPCSSGFRLRWFTPTAEVDLCGHATLASAHILWETQRLRPDDCATFHTRSGSLTCTRDRDGIVMDFPAKAATACQPPMGLLAALGVDAAYIGRNHMDYLVQIADDKTLKSIAPDFAALKKLNVRGVIVTARSSDPAFDFVSRFFAPAVGVNEDPVTGSAHCCLAPFWAAQLGCSDMKGFQASSRGGVVHVRVRNDRVHLIGRAVTVVSGTLLALPD